MSRDSCLSGNVLFGGGTFIRSMWSSSKSRSRVCGPSYTPGTAHKWVAEMWALTQLQSTLVTFCCCVFSVLDGPCCSCSLVGIFRRYFSWVSPKAHGHTRLPGLASVARHSFEFVHQHTTPWLAFLHCTTCTLVSPLVVNSGWRQLIYRNTPSRLVKTRGCADMSSGAVDMVPELITTTARSQICIESLAAYIYHLKQAARERNFADSIQLCPTFALIGENVSCTSRNPTNLSGQIDSEDRLNQRTRQIGLFIDARDDTSTVVIPVCVRCREVSAALSQSMAKPPNYR